jgi:hypothetical protein
MVKQESYESFDRHMREYQIRTAYGNLQNNPPSKPTKRKYQHPTPRYDAHEKSHSKLDLPDPFDHQHGRINRTKQSHQQQNEKTKIQSTHVRESDQSTVPTTNKKGCCCF